ncbi:hypothetical protein F7725_005425 [Dissostichus mawsoni]|uniref:SEA domain-containing protein n=1 Tax=Dissostichus mawsoni TaxID=36200 RepID=A0A7J5YRP4_DISMA|nr:hypothetical protein F7725_005425 [Dissostichus mawsoni]
MQQTFTPQLANKSSPAFLELKNKVTTALDMVYSEQYGSSFNRTVINSFSQGSVVVDVELIFNEGNTLPNATSVAGTLVTASSSSNFSLSVNTSSISATGNASTPPVTGTSAPPSITTTSSPTTTTTTTPTPTTTEPKLKLVFKMQETFTPQLANKSSPAFLELKNKVTTALDMVYSEQYGSSFNRTVINSFSQGSVVVDTELIFNEGNTLPNTTSVAGALVTASSSSNFSLSVNTSSISATGNASTPPVTGTSAPPSITTTSSPTTTTTTTPTPTTTEPKLKLVFKMQETFTPQLANKSSPAFLELNNKVTTALDMVYSEQYGSSFNRTVINSFSQGSVVVDAELIFNEGNTLPNTTSVAGALVTASSSSNFSLSVNTSSISATALRRHHWNINTTKHHNYKLSNYNYNPNTYHNRAQI